jgi:hypothetical protein
MATHQLVLMPRKGVCKSERHKVHAERENGTPLCGGGYQAKSSPAWQADIGPVNCAACLTIMGNCARTKSPAAKAASPVNQTPA